MNALRIFVRWSCSALVPAEFGLMLGLASGVTISPVARRAVEASVLIVVATTLFVLAADYHRHRRSGRERRPALRAAVADTVPAVVRKLTVHEIVLGTSFLRWVTRRGANGVRQGDIALPYAAGQTAAMFAFLFISIVETVALDYFIPWPVLRSVVLVLDLWGVYFVLALHASCVVRPHVIGSDGSLRLRYGGLIDVRIPAERIASVRLERRYAGEKRGAVDADGVAVLGVSSETTVTVELTEPVAYVRVLGKAMRAKTFRFYADDPAAAVAALRSRSVTTST
jgi:hypothetical protein